MISKKQFLYSILSVLWMPVVAQTGAADTTAYPQDYFRNPLDIPIFLAGNFGECRPGHFHSGVDIKTLGKEGQPVHAAADGYISRIKMEKGGFGHGIYITHPNGYTTLYAHLSDFMPDIQQYVKNEQYKQKRWDVDLGIAPDQFPVSKGQQIAWSGNTGASTAPHLHFEIRNTKTEHPLNPELFGLPVIDNIPPVVKEVAIYNLDKSIYEQQPYIIPVKKEGDDYIIDKKINDDYHVINGAAITDAQLTGIGINADDFMEGSDNTIAFLTAKLYVDDSLQCEIKLDNIGYDETRYINAYADYKTKELKHEWLQCFFKLAGNHLNGIYPFLNKNNGGLTLSYSDNKIIANHVMSHDDNLHRIKIVIVDDRNNTSTVLFDIKSNGTPPHPDLHDGTLEFKARQQNNFTDPNVTFSLDGRQLYDNIYFVFKKTPDAEVYSDRYQLHYAYVPVDHYFDLQIKPNKPIPFNLRSKVVMMYTDDKDVDGRAASFEDNGWYKARVRNFGIYWLDIDTKPPVIKSLQRNNANLSKAKQITFEVTDDKTSVKNFSGYLDGKWICFEQHSDNFFYKFDEHCSRGKHILLFKAEDENGNTAVYNLTFTR